MVVKQARGEGGMSVCSPGLGPVMVTREAHRDKESLVSGPKARLGQHTPMDKNWGWVSCALGQEAWGGGPR